MKYIEILFLLQWIIEYLHKHFISTTHLDTIDFDEKMTMHGG
jgi:hypothetical protein